MKKCLYAIIAFSVALAIRLYPTFLSGLPFSTDAWSPIRNTELLLERTPISLDNAVMDGYNCYWPANSLFGAVFSQATGLKPMVAMAFGIPLAGALTIPIFYALICRISGSRRLAFFSSILLATAYPYALFTAGVTKETYANPLYVLSILIFMSRGKWRKTLLFAVASSALVMAHHLTALVAIAVLATIALASSIVRARRGVSPDRSSFLLVSILTAATALYFWLYAYRGFKVAVTPSDLLSAASYQVLALAVTLYLTFKPQKTSNWKTPLTCIASAAIISLIAFLCTKRPITPDAPTLPSHYMLYAAPFILASPLIVLGVGELRGMPSENSHAPLFWLSALVGLEAYAVFGDSPLGLTLAYRTLDFLCIPLIILSALGLQRLYKARGGSRRAAKAAAITALIAVAALNSYNMYASVSLQERYMGYFWLYRQPEYCAAAWVKGTACNQTIAGDVKASYMLSDYFGLNVNALQGLQYLTGKTGSKPQILFTYEQMERNGYVIYGGYSVDLPENWMEKTFQLNLIYSNRVAHIYAG
jgi:hypothetical protein